MILFGASGHSKVIIDILEVNGIKVEKIFDDALSIVKYLDGLLRKIL